MPAVSCMLTVSWLIGLTSVCQYLRLKKPHCGTTNKWASHTLVGWGELIIGLVWLPSLLLLKAYLGFNVSDSLFPLQKSPSIDFKGIVLLFLTRTDISGIAFLSYCAFSVGKNNVCPKKSFILLWSKAFTRGPVCEAITTCPVLYTKPVFTFGCVFVSAV